MALFLGGFRSQKLSKKSMFFLKNHCAETLYKYRCFCFLRLVAMEDAIFEFVAIYGVLGMCFLKTL